MKVSVQQIHKTMECAIGEARAMRPGHMQITRVHVQQPATTTYSLANIMNTIASTPSILWVTMMHLDR